MMMAWTLLTGMSLMAGAPALDPPPVQHVLAQYRSARPSARDLMVYQLDWVLTLQQAKEKAAKEQRPILLFVVTHSYGNLFTGHC